MIQGGRVATEVASIYGILSLKDDFSGPLDAAEKKSKGFGDRLKSVGDNATALGGAMSLFAAPLAAGFGAATARALAFDTSMTNVQAVLGKTDDDMAALNAEVLALGTASTSGPQKASDAFYHIVGGIADATAHMDVLDTSLDVATAGSAELGGVVDALVKSVNIFGLEAKDAGRAGDVLVRAVAVGVGTMDEFASALPPVSGLAKELGLEFDETGGYLAYMSTKSASVAEGGTQLRGVFSKLINPTDDLATAIESMGYESGKALIEQEGLVGGLEKIKEFGGGSFSGLITDQEALLGAIALTTEGTQGFLDNYTTGIEGATEAAMAIQLDSPAAQMDLLKSAVDGLGITVGNALLPGLQDLTETITPIIGAVQGWVQENPELVTQIAQVAGVVGGLGAGLLVLGPILGGIGGAFAAITSPIGIAVAAGAALVAAYHTNFGGMRDFVDTEVRPRIEQFLGVLGNAWETVRPGLEALAGWFINDGLPAIQDFITNTVAPAISDFFGIIEDVWNVVSPALSSVFDWFMASGLPAIQGFIENTVAPAIEGFFGIIEGAWALIGPVLGDIFDWFVTNGLPEIKKFIDSVGTRVEEFIGTLQGIWNAVQGPLNSLKDGIMNVLKPIEDLINGLIGGFESLKGLSEQQQQTRDAVSASGIGQDELWERTLAAAGGNDFMARIAFAGLSDAAAPESRDSGGHGVAGQPYLIGRGAQPELFVPKTSGTFVPNANRMGGPQIGTVIVQANNAREGREAGDAFVLRVNELMRANG